MYVLFTSVCCGCVVCARCVCVLCVHFECVCAFCVCVLCACVCCEYMYLVCCVCVLCACRKYVSISVEQHVRWPLFILFTCIKIVFHPCPYIVVVMLRVSTCDAIMS